MKKGRLLALTLVVAVMLVGAGYAYWSESLVINSSVDTGDLEVIFEEPANILEDQPNSDCTPSEDGKSMLVTYKEAHPGLRNNFEFTLANVGTLGAYVDDFKFSSGNLNADYILCERIQIGENEKAFDGNLQEALNYLNDYNGKKGIKVDTTLKNGETSNYSYTKGTEYVKLSLRFNPDLNNVNFKQDGRNDSEGMNNKEANYSFKINANVYQFNARDNVEEIPQ